MKTRILSITPVAIAALAAIVSLQPGRVLADPVEVITESVRFSSHGQSLWGPVDGELTKSFRVDLIDEEWSGSEGEMHENVPVEVDNSGDVDAWEIAVDTCDRSQYCHDFGFPVGTQCISPTRSQCINGACLSILGVQIKCVSGIGARPAGTVSREYDIGAELEYETRLRWGITGGITFDGGTVDVDYDADVEIEIDESGAGGDTDGIIGPGEVFTIRTREISGDATLRSQWPNVSGRLATYTDALARVEFVTAGPNTQTGAQMRETATFFHEDTGGVIEKELVGFHAGVGGIEVQVLDEPFFEVDAGIELGLAVEVAIPGVGDIGFPYADVGLFSPEMDTPVSPDFDGLFIPTPYDGTRVGNYVAPGPREFFSYGIIDDGLKDTDVIRIDNDLDVLTAFAWLVPVGVSGGVGTIIPGALSLLEVEGNIFDLDTASFYGFREDLEFEPRLAVILRFGEPTLVETAPGSGEFTTVLEKLVRIGDELRAIHPGGELSIDTTYTLVNNLFTNDTDFIGSPAIQGTILQLKFGGLLPTFGGAFGLPTNFAAAQITQEIGSEPAKIADLDFLDGGDKSRFSIGGFEDVGGGSLTVRAGATFLRGDGNADGRLDISDASFALNWLFLGGDDPTCAASINVNGDAKLDISDPSYLLNFLFLGGADPAAPFPGCGVGELPSDAEHGCENPADCR